jgi:hypothetical protein
MARESGAKATEPDDELGDWEHGFLEAYLYLHGVEGEPTHEQFLAALNALERFVQTRHPRQNLPN